jgi:hypothetical protein
MRPRRADEHMQTQACILLSELVVRSSNPAAALAPTEAAHATAAVIAAMGRAPIRAFACELQHRGCYALAVVWPAACASAAASQGAVADAVVRAMAAHATAAKVLHRALRNTPHRHDDDSPPRRGRQRGRGAGRAARIPRSSAAAVRGLAGAQHAARAGGCTRPTPPPLQRALHRAHAAHTPLLLSWAPPA